jgi:hypothetical protein
MIRYEVTRAKLNADVTALDASWFDDTAAVLASLPDPPKSSDFKPLWSNIKQLYIDLQNSKCCFCEKPLEGMIEQDVEHFRPKAEVKPWIVPAKLANEGIAVQQPTDGSSEGGYSQLAYHPFNYAMSCKTCNSTLKKNLFPIEGPRDSGSVDPSKMKSEKALLIYPIGDLDSDPEDLIEFRGLSPVPKKASGYGRRRAMVTIDIFRLDRRRDLMKQRAYLVRLLFLELEGLTNAATAALRAIHQKAIDALTSSEAPFTNCMNCFADLYRADPTHAGEIADECLKFMQTKSH